MEVPAPWSVNRRVPPCSVTTAWQIERPSPASRRRRAQPLGDGNGQTGTIVGDDDLDEFTVGAGRDANARTLGRVAYGVLEQVVAHLLEQRRIRTDERKVGRHVDLEPPVHEQTLQPMCTHRHEFGDVDLGQPGLERPGLDPAHAEQVRDETIQASGFVDEHVENLVSGARS